MDCTECGAPLPAKSRICPYCSTLNDVDLRQRRTSRVGEAARSCPRCETTLAILRLKLARPVGEPPREAVEFDRCPECHGIFFDPGELEDILHAAEGRAPQVDPQRLAVLAEEETETRDFEEVRYVACPDCAKLMNRKSYGARSGVVVDRCREHGVWLDGGELRRLVEWSRAGGRLHHEEREAEKKAMEERLREVQKRGESVDPTGPPLLLDTPEGSRGFGGGGLPGGGGLRPASIFEVLADLARILS